MNLEKSGSKNRKKIDKSHIKNLYLGKKLIIVADSVILRNYRITQIIRWGSRKSVVPPLAAITTRPIWLIF